MPKKRDPQAGYTAEIKRVREELAAIESRMLVINRTIDRLSTEGRKLRESKDRLEVWLVSLECQLTEE